jgi:uncharacterized protein
MTRTIFAIDLSWLAASGWHGHPLPLGDHAAVRGTWPRNGKAWPCHPASWRALFFAALAVALAAGCDQPQHLATATIKVAGKPLVVEVARTEAERRKGMMFRSSLGPDETMLFVFARPANLAFWMKNTLVDLDLAYIDANGRVTQVATMKALDETAVPSVEPVRFVLEAPKGWMAAHKVAAGTPVEIPPEVDRPADR